MRPASFAYECATSVEQALKRLEADGWDAKVLAGGQSLIAHMNLRLAHPTLVIDIGRLDELRRIDVRDGVATIGALATHAAVEDSSELLASHPMLHVAARHIAHRAIRNRGTFGGSLAHADPAAEWPVAVLALRGRVGIRSATGARQLASVDFFSSHYTTALEDEELLTETVLPAMASGAGWSFVEIAQQRGAFGLALVAAVVQVDGDGALTDATVCVGACAPVPILLATDALLGRRLDADELPAVAQELTASLDPPTDVRATAAHRRQIASVLVCRALGRALDHAKGAP